MRQRLARDLVLLRALGDAQEPVDDGVSGVLTEKELEIDHGRRARAPLQS